MKTCCTQCGHTDNEVHLIADCDIDRHLYDWYAFECKRCGYTCSFSVKKKKRRIYNQTDSWVSKDW